MVVFNPEVRPTNDPNYMGFSKPISDVPGNQGFETALKGAGNVLGQAINVADYLTKKGLSDELYEKVTTRREAENKSLQTIKDALPAATVGVEDQQVAGDLSKAPVMAYDDEAADGKLKVLEENLGPINKVPPELNSLPGKVSAIKDARENGKLSPTRYYADLEKISTEMRARYPGYREYIDKQMESIAGVDPANARMKSLMGDINASISSLNSQNNRVVSWARQHLGIPGMPREIEKFMNGQISEIDIYKFAAPRMALEDKWKLKRLAREDAAGDSAEDARIASEDVTKLINQEVNFGLDNINLSQGLRSFKDVQEAFVKHQSGQLKFSDEAWQQMGQSVTAFKQSEAARIRAKLYERGPDGKSFADRIGSPKAVNDLINQSLSSYDDLSSAIFAKDSGAAFSAANLAKAKINDTEYGLLNDTTIGERLLIGATIRKLGGDHVWGEYFKRTMMPADAKNPNFGEYVRTQVGRWIAQPDARKLSTVSSSIEDIKARDRANGTNYAPQAIKNYVENIAILEGPVTPENREAKLNLARAFFDPSNRNLLSQIKPDSQDPITGKMVPGKLWMFQKLTNDRVAETIFTLGDDQLKNNYTNLVREWFGLQIYNREINDLNKIDSTAFGTKIGYDTKSHQFTLTSDKKFRPGEDTSSSREFVNRHTARAQGIINRINMGLQNVSVLAKHTGEDVDAYLLSLMIGMGFNPARLEGNGLPEQIANAIYTAKARELLGNKSNKEDKTK